MLFYFISLFFVVCEFLSSFISLNFNCHSNSSTVMISKAFFPLHRYHYYYYYCSCFCYCDFLSLSVCLPLLCFFFLCRVRYSHAQFRSMCCWFFPRLISLCFNLILLGFLAIAPFKVRPSFLLLQLFCSVCFLSLI